MLIELTPISDAALPVDALKAHLRLGSGFGQDSLQEPVLTSFLRAAVAAVEARTGRILFKRSFKVAVTEWRNCDQFALPVAPVTSVSRLEALAPDAALVVLDAESWWLEQDAMVPKLRATGASLPRVPARGSISIFFDAGFSVGWDGIPADLRQAVLMLAAHYYEYRDDTGLSEGCMPFGVSRIIDRYRLLRMGGGAAR